MPHLPAYHILNSTFPEQDEGLALPTRLTGASGNEPVLVAPTGAGQNTLNTIQGLPEGLRITNLDRERPPNYQPGVYPRSTTYNRNVFRITAEPAGQPPPASAAQIDGPRKPPPSEQDERLVGRGTPATQTEPLFPLNQTLTSAPLASS